MTAGFTTGSTSAGTAPFDHAPALDGIRGLAVAAVVVYHVVPGALPGGFIGVDVFFVLSGFLLSALLVREVEATGGVDLGRFAVRRVRRLLPATLVVLVAVAGYALAWADGSELDRIRDHSIAALTYTSNWWFIADGTTYSDVILGASPLRHMWSLAIEEQFYVVLALVATLLAVVSRFRSRWLRPALGGGALLLALVSALWMIVAERSGAELSRLYFGTDTRAQALLAGVAVGVVRGDRLLTRRSPTRSRARWSALAFVAGFSTLVVLALVGAEDARWMYRGGFALVAIASLATIAGALSSPAAGRLLSPPPLVGLGTISYGVYLWHWPVLTILDADRFGFDGAALHGAQIAITLLLASVSFVLVESPVRRGAIGATLGRSAVLVAPLACLAVGGLVVVATASDGGEPDEAAVGQTADDPALADPDLLQIVALGDSAMHTLIGGDLAGPLQAVPWNQEQSSFDRSEVALTTIARPACSFLPGEVAFEIAGGGYETADLSPPCGDWRSDLAEAVTRPVPATITLVMPTNDLEDRRVDGEIVAFGSSGWDDLFFDWLLEVTGIAQSGGSTVVLTAPAPRIDPNWSSPQGEREAHVAAIFQAFAEANPGVESIDLGEFVGDDAATRDDGLHYTDDGADRVATWLTPQLEAIAAGA